jgi:hypothetical protein
VRNRCCLMIFHGVYHYTISVYSVVLSLDRIQSAAANKEELVSVWYDRYRYARIQESGCMAYSH